MRPKDISFEESHGDLLNLPQFNGHFKKYTESYTIEEKGVSDEKTEAVV
jgi:hypothetical protein